MNKLVRKTGILISILSLMFLLGDNLVSYLWNGVIILDYQDILITIFFITIFLSIFHQRGDYIQVVAFMLSSFVTFILSYRTGYGITQLFIIIILAHKYSLLKNRFYLKIALFSTIYLLVILLSSLRLFGNFQHCYTFVLYYILILVSVVYIKLYELKTEESTNALQDAYFTKIESYYLDPKEFNLTTTEFEILKSLCLYNERNIDLALRHNKSINTIKVHMRRILLKSGAETRHQLIDLCRGYFLKI